MVFEKFIPPKRSRATKTANAEAAPDPVVHLPEREYTDLVAVATQYGITTDRLALEALVIGMRVILSRHDSYNRKVFAEPPGDTPPPAPPSPRPRRPLA